MPELEWNLTASATVALEFVKWLELERAQWTYRVRIVGLPRRSAAGEH